jgi:hypothetical protein
MEVIQGIISVFAFILANYEVILASIVAICSAIIAIALLIPGEQPEKTLQKIVDFIAKFSRK